MERRAKPLLERVSDAGDSSFARALGSVDYHTRDQGLHSLTVYLSSQSNVSTEDMRKLWKGLFYCFWHSDKVPVQEELATRLAAILTSLSTKVAVSYIGVFWETVEREWFGIDRLRLDKFLMLVRKFVHQQYVFLERANWDKTLVGTMFKFWEELMSRSDQKASAGLTYQLADICVPELLSLDSGSSIPDASLRQLLDMFVRVLASTSRATLLPRIRDGVFGRLIQELQLDPAPGVLEQLNTQALAEHIFAAGSAPGVKVKTRQALYKLSSELEILASAKRKRSRDSDSDDAEPSGSGEGQANGEGDDSAAPKKQRVSNGGPAASAANGRHSPEASPPPAAVKSKPARSKKLRALPRVTASQFPAPDSDPEAAPEIRGSISPAPSDEEVELANVASKELRKQQRAGKRSAVQKIKRAAGRTLAALSAHKSGKATVNPATPGSPSVASVGNLFQDTLNGGSAELKTPSPTAEPTTPSPSTLPGKGPSFKTKKRAAQRAASLPGGDKKHVRFVLKSNQAFEAGDPTPEANVRTPLSCRPKGSALKKVSKFPNTAIDGRRTRTPTWRSRPVSLTGGFSSILHTV